MKIVTLIALCALPWISMAEQSSITEADGYSCMGVDYSKKQTETLAIQDAKRKAVEYSQTFIQSTTVMENFSLKKTIQTIREGSYHRDHQSIIQGDSIAISGNKIRNLPGRVYDPVSFVYYLRNQDLRLGNSYIFFSYDRKKIKEVIVNITAKEIVQVSAGTFSCLKIEPVSGDGTPLLKNNGQMRIWLSDDSLRLPVKIEQKTNIGTMVMKLKEIKHIY